MRSLSFAALCGLATACGGSAPMHDGPNVLLVSVDTLRADHLGTYGYSRPTSPRIDAFAETAVVFEHCQASASWTLPSMASVFTSTYSSTNRCWSLGARLDDTFTTLAEVLLAKGYDTACVVSHLFCTTRHGLQQGFVHFDDSYAYPEVDPDEAITSQVISDRGIRFLEQKARVADGRPWLLWLHYFDPHDDYMWQPEHTPKFVVEGAQPSAVDLYDGEIAYTDQHIGRVLDALEREGLAASTLVVLVADHGEEFHEHGGVGHGTTLFGEQIRVPFLVRAPSIAPGRVSSLVRTVDLMPTVLDLVGLEGHSESVGRSLAPWMRGPRASALDEAPALSETRMGANAHLESVVDGGLELVRHRTSGAVSLFDLVKDPAEQRDLASTRADDVKRLEADLDALIAEAEAKSEGYEFAPAQIDPAVASHLSGLGYVEGEGEEAGDARPPGSRKPAARLARGSELRETFYADGKPWAEIRLEGGVPHGAWTTWHPDGSLASRGVYANGRRAGPWTTWHANGKRLSEGRYENGRQVGPWEYWFASGKAASRGTYVDGHLEGLWKSWYGNGNLRATASFDDRGVQHGISSFHWPDGTPKQEARFEHGVKTRERFTHENGQVMGQGAVLDGHREGVWRWWNRDGSYNLKLSGVYRDRGVFIAPVPEELMKGEEPFEL